MLEDYHVHTAYSLDSQYPMEEVIKDAIKMGMKEICFTDHVDYGIKVDTEEIEKAKIVNGIPFLNVDYPQYMKEIERMKNRYQDQITIKTGLEFGIQTHTIPQYEKLYQRYDYDFIILSIHQIEDKELWNQEFQKDKTQKEYNERYYQELFEIVKNYKNYSVLGHLDVISRYDIQKALPFENIQSQITEILKAVIQDGKGIELNTSYHRYGLSNSTPSLDILKLYYELGGKIITLGSDSHKLSDLGAYIEEGKQYLKEIGFKEYCTFDKMTPIFHPL